MKTTKDSKSSRRTLGAIIDRAEVIVVQFGMTLEGRRIGGETTITRAEARALASIYPDALAAEGESCYGTLHGDGWTYGRAAVRGSGPLRLVFHARAPQEVTR